MGNGFFSYVETSERKGHIQNSDDGPLRRTMTQVKLSMPTLNDDEEDWLCYIGAIKIASQRLGINMGRTRQESLYLGWQVHRLAMSVMATEVWKKYPSVKKLVWNNLKNTVGFMDEMMNYNDISRTDRAKWRGDYSSYMDARNKAEGRYYYVFRCRSKAEEDAGDTKRKMETTITTEIVVKRQKVENREENDKEMEDMVEVENIDLTETAETGDEAEEEEVTATEKMDVTGIRGIFEVDSDEEEEAEGDAGDPQRVVVEDEDGGGEDKLGVASLTKYEPNNSKEVNGRCKNKEERATGTKETTITTEILFKRGIFEDSDEDEAAVNEEKRVTGTRATSEGEEEEEVENEEELDIEEKDLVEGDMVKLGTVPQSERPEFEGLCGVDKREGVFIDMVDIKIIETK